MFASVAVPSVRVYVGSRHIEGVPFTPAKHIRQNFFGRSYTVFILSVDSQSELEKDYTYSPSTVFSSCGSMPATYRGEHGFRVPLVDGDSSPGLSWLQHAAVICLPDRGKASCGLRSAAAVRFTHCVAAT